MTTLPGPNDPLVLLDGRRIDVTTGRAVKQSSTRPLALASSGDSRSAASPTRRRIDDLGIKEPALVSSLMIVAAFKIANFDDIDIVNALGTSHEMLATIENHDKFKTVYDLLVESIQSTAYSDARAILQMHAPRAAEVLVEGLDEDDPVHRQIAADKVLARAGIGNDAGNGGGSGFRIEIVEKNADKDASISIKVGV